MSAEPQAERIAEGLWELGDLEPDETLWGMDLDQFTAYVQGVLDQRVPSGP